MNNAQSSALPQMAYDRWPVILHSRPFRFVVGLREPGNYKRSFSSALPRPVRLLFEANDHLKTSIIQFIATERKLSFLKLNISAHFWEYCIFL
jgi:hypothetical protein